MGDLTHHVRVHPNEAPGDVVQTNWCYDGWLVTPEILAVILYLFQQISTKRSSLRHVEDDFKRNLLK